MRRASPGEETIPVVATIGVFDGVHRGHRALLEIVLERARALGLPAAAVTFDPHPISVFSPAAVRHRITPARTKLRLLAEVGIDLAMVLRFSRELASLPAGEFVDWFLRRRLRVRELWVGYDFRFGRGREGDVSFLRREGERRGFEVQQFGPVHDAGRILSSSWVREALARGAIEEAEGVLGHSFSLEGRVGRGRGLGARLLVATANLELPDEQILPEYGIYTAWAELEGALVPSVVSVGVRPTVADDPRPVVEAHLIDWEGDLRERPLALHFGTRLREERRYPGLDELREAIHEDIRMARAWLEEHPPAPVPAAAKTMG